MSRTPEPEIINLSGCSFYAVVGISLALNHEKYKLKPRYSKEHLPYIYEEILNLFDMTKEQMNSRKKPEQFVFPRDIFCYAARELTGARWLDIAKLLGKKEHSSSLSAHRKVQQILIDNVDIKFISYWNLYLSKTKWF
jgi:chromosomal replication initiator protein